ncbi:MAG TPA: DUF3276 family protein, partial [Ferruginibacter sp.]|nr:DUF3276 family protein [Ferruginibacter sp.]
RFDSEGYDRHKIFLYKEDFNKFLKGLTEAIDFVKTDLMPDFDFDAFNHDTPYEGDENSQQPRVPEAGTVNENNSATETTTEPAASTEESKETPSEDNGSTEEVDKW